MNWIIFTKNKCSVITPEIILCFNPIGISLSIKYIKVDLYVGATIIKNNINETVKPLKYILRLFEYLNKYKQYMNIGVKITAALLGYMMK